MKVQAWIAIGLALIGFGDMAALAQESSYPSKPVHILVPFTAGTNADIIARIYAEKLTALLGQPFIVDDRPGAGGVIAAEALLGAPADGYTLLFVAPQIATNVVFTAKLPYDIVRDFAPISLTSSTPLLLVANLAFPAKSVQELIAFAHNGDEVEGYKSIWRADRTLRR